MWFYGRSGPLLRSGSAIKLLMESRRGSRIEDVQDVLSGVAFPDLYHWLEENKNEVRSWQKRQAEMATAYVTGWEGFEKVRNLVEKCSNGATISLSRFAAGHWFWIQSRTGNSGSVVLMSDIYGEHGRVVFDLTVELGSSTRVIS